LGPF